jgi:hypothetical protein
VVILCIFALVGYAWGFILRKAIFARLAQWSQNIKTQHIIASAIKGPMLSNNTVLVPNERQ